MTKTTTQPSPPLPRNVILLGWTSFLNDVASEMVYPLLPKFITEVLKASKMQLGLIEGLADMVASFLRLFAGSWSDALGRRREFILFGYSLAAVLRPLIGLATLPWHVLLARAGDRFGKGIRAAPRDALITESITPDQRGRAFGFHQAMDHMGATLGPIIAALFLYFLPGEYRWLFLVAAIPGAMAVAVLALGLKPPSQPQQRENIRFQLSLKPFHWRFKAFLAILVLFTMGCASDAFLLIRASEIGVASWQLPILWGMFCACKSIGNYSLGRLVDRFGAARFIISGWLLYGLIYLGFAGANQTWHVWALFIVYSLFYALTEPAEKTLVAEMSTPGTKGLAFGWFHFVLGIMILPANLLFGWLYDHYGPAAALVMSAGFAFVAVLLFSWLYWAGRSNGQRPQETRPFPSVEDR